jgi:hypothetical protein
MARSTVAAMDIIIPAIIDANGWSRAAVARCLAPAHHQIGSLWNTNLSGDI